MNTDDFNAGVKDCKLGLPAVVFDIHGNKIKRIDNSEYLSGYAHQYEVEARASNGRV